MAQYYLSPERFEELKKELEFLRNERRREVAERLQRAKEYGDLSENAEYAEAREEQSRVETRIAELDDLLKSASIIKKSGEAATVQIGSTVTVEKNKKEITYTIVGSNESDPAGFKISNESPTGKAFLGKKSGDRVSVDTPTGPANYTIIKIA